MDLTQIVLVGRLLDDPKDIEYEMDSFYTDIHISVCRPFRDCDGQFIFDTFTVSLWKGAGFDLKVAGKKGCLVCISGRLETIPNKETNEARTMVKLIAEKCSFISI